MLCSNCCFLTCIQVSQEAGKTGIPISSRLFQFVLIHTVKGFCVVNGREADIFLEFPYFLYDTRDVGNFISGPPAFSKPSLCIGKFLIQVLLMPSLKDFEHNLTSMGNKCNYPVVSTASTTGFLLLLHSPYWWLYCTSCFITCSCITSQDKGLIFFFVKNSELFR